MRRIRLVLAVVAAMVAMLVAIQGPAMADDGFVFIGDDDDAFGLFDDNFDDGFFFDDFFFGGDVVQTFDQESESGDLDLSFEAG